MFKKSLIVSTLFICMHLGAKKPSLYDSIYDFVKQDRELRDSIKIATSEEAAHRLENLTVLKYKEHLQQTVAQCFKSPEICAEEINVTKDTASYIKNYKHKMGVLLYLNTLETMLSEHNKRQSGFCRWAENNIHGSGILFLSLFGMFFVHIQMGKIISNIRG